MWSSHHRATFAFNGKAQISGVWVSHALSQDQKNLGVGVCAFLLARHRLARVQHRPFLSYIVTADETWRLYANISKIKEWLSPNKTSPHTKTCAHAQKIMLCIWWNNEGELYYELLPRGVNITAEHLLPKTDVLRMQSKKKDQQQTLYRSWVWKSCRTHFRHLILRPQIFTFSALYRTAFKELPFRIKMCSKHSLTSSTQNHAIYTVEKLLQRWHTVINS